MSLAPSCARIAAVLLTAACAGDIAPDSDATFAIDSGYVEADDGVRLFYRTVGTGETDVVIPVGLYLEELLTPLAAPGRRLVFYDPRARGRSEAGDRSRITLDRQIADLESIRRGLGIDSMIVIGWSGLGMETAVYAIRYPDRVRRLVQVAPVAARDTLNLAAYRERAARTDTAAVARVRERRRDGDLAGDDAAYCRAVRDVTTTTILTDPALQESVPDVCRFPNEYPDSLNLLFQSLLTSFRGYDWRSAIAALPVTRLVIHGRLDAFPLQGSREWVPRGSAARLLVLDGAGHLPFLEQPDAFFAAVDTFLEGEWPARAVQPPFETP